jgi:hypothetical protein
MPILPLMRGRAAEDSSGSFTHHLELQLPTGTLTTPLGSDRLHPFIHITPVSLRDFASEFAKPQRSFFHST